MKKLVLALLCLSSIYAIDFDNELKYEDINYAWNYKEKKCVKNKEVVKKSLLNLQKTTKDVKVVNIYPFMSGTISEVEILINKEEGVGKYMFMETYGACKLYEDTIYKKIEVKDSRKYKDLKDPNLI